MKTMGVLLMISLVFNGLDILSGFIGALKNKELNSSKMRDGFFKKAGFVFLNVLAVVIEYSRLYIDIPIGVNLVPITVGYTVLNEIISIVENICILNPKLVPQKIKELLELKE